MYLYVIYDQEYKRELEKIEFLERKKLLKEKKLEQIRERTTPCHITELDTPRRCYLILIINVLGMKVLKGVMQKIEYIYIL